MSAMAFMRGGGCPVVRRRLSLLIDGELSARRRRGTIAHLTGCPWCRRVFDALSATVADLRAAGERWPERDVSVAPVVVRRIEAGHDRGTSS